MKESKRQLTDHSFTMLFKFRLNNAEIESRSSKKIGAKTIIDIQHYIQLNYIIFKLIFQFLITNQINLIIPINK